MYTNKLLLGGNRIIKINSTKEAKKREKEMNQNKELRLKKLW